MQGRRRDRQAAMTRRSPGNKQRLWPPRRPEGATGRAQARGNTKPGDGARRGQDGEAGLRGRRRPKGGYGHAGRRGDDSIILMGVKQALHLIKIIRIVKNGIINVYPQLHYPTANNTAAIMVHMDIEICTLWIHTIKKIHIFTAIHLK